MPMLQFAAHFRKAMADGPLTFRQLFTSEIKGRSFAVLLVLDCRGLFSAGGKASGVIYQQRMTEAPFIGPPFSTQMSFDTLRQQNEEALTARPSGPRCQDAPNGNHVGRGDSS